MNSRGPEEHADSHRRRRASSGRKPQHASSAAGSRLKQPYRDSLREDYEPGNTSAIESDSETSDYNAEGSPSMWDDNQCQPRQPSPGRRRTTSSASRSKMDSFSSQAYLGSRAGPWPSHRSSSGMPPPGSGLSPDQSSWYRPKQSSSPPNVEPEFGHHRRKSSSAKSSKVPSSGKTSTRHRSHWSSRDDQGFHESANESVQNDSGDVDAEKNSDAKKASPKKKTYDGLPVLDVKPEVCDPESDGESVGDEKEEPRLITAGEQQGDEKEVGDKKASDSKPKAPATAQTAKDSTTAKAKPSTTEPTPLDKYEDKDDGSSDGGSEYTDSESQSDDEDGNSNKQLISIDSEKQQIAEILPAKDPQPPKDSQTTSKDAKDSKHSQDSTAPRESARRSRRRSSRKSSHHDYDFPNRTDLPRVPSPPIKPAAEISGEPSDSESGACSSKHHKHGRRSSMRSSGRSSRRPTSENYTTKPHVPESPQPRSGTMPVPVPTGQRNRRSRRSNSEWTEHETGGSISSDHRGSFSHASRPSSEAFSRRPDGYDHGWNPQAGSGNSNMSQSPDYNYAGVSESNDEGLGRHSSSHARSSRHRNSSTQHSSTPPVSQYRRRESFHDRAPRESASRPANILMPEAPEAPTDSPSGRRPHHPSRTMSSSSTRASEPVMPPVPPSPNSATSDKRRRPSYTSGRPAMVPQRPGSAIPEESGDETGTSRSRADSYTRAPTMPIPRSRRESAHEETATRPAGRRSSKHSSNPPAVPFAPGTTESSPEEGDDDDDDDIPPMAAARTEICHEYDDEMGCDSSDDGFPADTGRLEDQHPFMACFEAASKNALHLYGHWYRAGGALRSPPANRFDFDGSTMRRPRGNSRVSDKQGGFDPSVFPGGASHSTRRRSSMSFQPTVFACPFPVHDKQQFSGCGGFVFPDITSLVIHIRWCHRFTIYCPRCMKTYPTYRERDAHLKAEPPCPTRNQTEHNGVLPEKRQQIYKIAKSNRPKLDQWKEIYEVIFPKTEAPSSTVINDDLLRQLNTFGDWNEQAGKQSALDVLETHNLLFSVPKEDVEIDVKSFTHRVYEATCHAMYNNWLDCVVGPESYASPGLDSPCTVSSDATGSNSFSPRTPSGSWGNSVPYSPAVNAARRMFPGPDPMNPRTMPRRQSITRGATMPPNPGMGGGMQMPPSMPMPMPMPMPMGMNAQPPMMGMPGGAAFGHSYTGGNGDEYMKMANMGGGNGYYDAAQFDGMVGSVPQMSSMPMVTPMNERYINSGYFGVHPKRPSY